MTLVLVVLALIALAVYLYRRQKAIMADVNDRKIDRATLVDIPEPTSTTEPPAPHVQTAETSDKREPVGATSDG